MTDRLRSRIVGALCAAVLLSGCGSAPDEPVAPGTDAPSITMVTVPGLTSSGLGPVRTSPGEGGVIPNSTPAGTDAAGGTLVVPDPAQQTTAPDIGSSTGDRASTTASSQGVSVGSSSVAPPRTPVPPQDPGTASSAAPPTVVAVDMTKCAGCQVIGVAAAVQPGLDAALATAPQGAVLLATRADGTVAGVTNVPYGVTFPAPVGGVLPCDRSGRCFVTAAQSQGNGVVSVFQLAAGGEWRDVTASGGFTSVTPTALVRDIDGDGLLDIAVQADAGGALRWVVYRWSGDRFVVLGCVASTEPAPGDAGVSLAACS